MKKIITLIFVLANIAISAQAQPQKIDYDAISRGTFSARGVYGIRPMKDGKSYTTLEPNQIIKHFCDENDRTIQVIPRTLDFRITDYQFSADETKLLLQSEREAIYRHSAKASYMIYDIQHNKLFALSPNGKQQEATFSPDGTKVAFVRENNIFIADIQSGTEQQITFDGVKGEVINGIPDWVYEEEYSFSRAFEWSPESNAIAFYRFDESKVKEYPMNVFKGELYPTNQTFKYPKAGEVNSEVRIMVYDLMSGSTTNMDIGSEKDQYIPRIKWTGRKNELAIHRVNRLQNSYQMLFANTLNGTSSEIYTENDKRYIERIDDDKVHFLADGKRFIVMNETDGWRHLYLYDMNGKFQSQITKGEWEVTEINGIDAANNRIYYTSTEISTIGRDFFAVDFGKSPKPNRNKKQFSYGDGYYVTNMFEGCKFYISSFSNSTTPTIVTLHSSDGKVVKIMQNNEALNKRLDNWDMPIKEFLTIDISGEKLNAYIIKPKDFDPSKKYPLFMTQYSGPGSQQVANRWGVSWETALVKEGYLVVCVDGRGTGFKGADFRKCTYGNLGGLETQDQIEAAKWFAKQSYVDAKRIGIYGWSYGGFMALNCILKGNDVFALAFAVAPVTSWRYYDTIYTEIFNGLPQDNPNGYDDNSPIFFADRLKGKLMLAHGTADDNVHIQNAYDMIEKLVQHNKEFEWTIYPDKDHGMGSSRNHMIFKAIKFIKTNL